jgi:hypothetical protein
MRRDRFLLLKNNNKKRSGSICCTRESVVNLKKKNKIFTKIIMTTNISSAILWADESQNNESPQQQQRANYIPFTQEGMDNVLKNRNKTDAPTSSFEIVVTGLPSSYSESRAVLVFTRLCGGHSPDRLTSRDIDEANTEFTLFFDTSGESKYHKYKTPDEVLLCLDGKQVEAMNAGCYNTLSAVVKNQQPTTTTTSSSLQQAKNNNDDAERPKIEDE